MTEPDIREAVAADAGDLVDVYHSAYRENRELGFPAKAESVSESEVRGWIRECRVYVATIEDEVVGGVRLEAADPTRVKLARLAVHEDWKGRGIGSRLLDRAEDAVRKWDREIVRLTTPEEHPYLPDLYRDRGYEKTEAYRLAYREYDEVVMEKRVR